MIKHFDRKAARARRHRRVRTKIRGTPERPRLSVFRSNLHVYAQLVDDASGRTLASASSVQLKAGKKGLEAAQLVGRSIAGKAVDKGLKAAVFDRGGFIYHGQVKALAEAAREAGLEF